MKILPLLLGQFHVNDQGEFSRLSPKSPPGGLSMGVQPFLIVTQNDLILIDLGVELGEFTQPLILKVLDEYGYEPSQITKILLSHLHKDHVMGLGYFTAEGFKPNFENAEIFVQKRALDQALSKVSSSYIQPLLEVLKTSNQVVFLDSDQGWISKEIYFEVSGGHTQFHQEFWIMSQNQTLFFGGDNLPQYSFWRRKLAYKIDYDGKKASELREFWKLEAEKKSWTVLFYHDLKRPIVQL